MRVKNEIDIDRIIAFHGDTADRNEEQNIIDGELGYEVNHIVELRRRRVNNRIVKDRCVVHWRGYDDSYETIHGIRTILQDAPYALKEFVDAQRRRPLLDADVDEALRALPDSSVTMIIAY